MDRKAIFSIITICYRRLGYLQESLAAMRRQSYPHLEIIIIDNGAIPEVRQYIDQMEKTDSRIKIVHFKENQYREDDPWHMNKICMNAGLDVATGDFVWYQSDDDIIADDYVEKMVRLFNDDPACTTAAGLVRSIDHAGQIMPEGPRVDNFRPRYMPGHLLALSTLNRSYPGAGQVMFNVPGSIFAIRRQELVKAGGYHALIELCHLYGVVPFGVTGFDETAILYWRRHEDQLNKYMGMRGVISIEVTLDFINGWHIEQRWEVFGKSTARYLIKHLYQVVFEEATSQFVINLYYLGFGACARILKSMWFRPYFWQHLPRQLWKQKIYIKYSIKEMLKKIFKSFPWLVEKFPRLLPLQERTFR